MTSFCKPKHAVTTKLQMTRAFTQPSKFQVKSHLQYR